MGRKKIKLFFVFYLTFLSVMSPLLLLASPKETKNTKEGKQAGYSGDPALKRGYELGYDDGVKNGKSDKKAGKKNSPTSSSEYKAPEKKFRHEYGNQAKFVSGYRSGFLKGYKAGFSREVQPEKTSKSGNITSQQNEKPQNQEALKNKTGKEVPLKTTPPPKKYNPAEDAL